MQIVVDNDDCVSILARVPMLARLVAPVLEADLPAFLGRLDAGSARRAAGDHRRPDDDR